jgi:hypothetical protein
MFLLLFTIPQMFSDYYRNKLLVAVSINGCLWYLMYSTVDVLGKPGGLNSPDQSKLRLRLLDLSRSIFETCQDYPLCWDKIFFCLGHDFYNRDFWIEIKLRQYFYWDCQDELRLSRFLRFVETFWDLSRYLNIIETFWGTSGSKILTNWEILILTNDKIN